MRVYALGEQGLTLVELLVVILIIGILAGIVIPSFLSQTDKAKDAVAKEGATSARTAIETYAVDNDGSYAGASLETLETIEPTLSEVNLSVDSATPSGYSLTATSESGNRFTVTRSGGEMSWTCVVTGQGGCPGNGSWSPSPNGSGSSGDTTAGGAPIGTGGGTGSTSGGTGGTGGGGSSSSSGDDARSREGSDRRIGRRSCMRLIVRVGHFRRAVVIARFERRVRLIERRTHRRITSRACRRLIRASGFFNHVLKEGH